MKALHLGLTNFRNYIQQDITFGDGVNVVYSDTAQGKTNILEAELFRDKRKKITANEVPIRKNSELVRRFNVVYFGPEYLGLVKEGPSIRRKNLDVLISQIKPGYISSLTEMKRIVESKNSISSL